MYTPKEDQIEDPVNLNWELGLDNITKTINYIHDNQHIHNKIDKHRLNWKFSGSKLFPSITICVYEVEMLTPVYTVKNSNGFRPLVKNDYPNMMQLIAAIINQYENHTRFELNGEK